MEYNLALTLFISVFLMAIVLIVLMYGISFFSIMDLAEYESWSEAMGWAIAITFALLTVSFFQFEIYRGEVAVYLNLIGVVAPVAVSLYLLLWRKVKVLPALVAMAVVAVIAFPFVTVEEGAMVTQFPYWLFPIAVAVGVSLLLVQEKDVMKIAALAYFAGSMGMFIGGDLLHALTIDMDSYDAIYFGARGLLDFVFLSGVICVGIVIFGDSLVRWANRSLTQREAELRLPPRYKE